MYGSWPTSIVFIALLIPFSLTQVITEMTLNHVCLSVIICCTLMGLIEPISGLYCILDSFEHSLPSLHYQYEETRLRVWREGVGEVYTSHNGLCAPPERVSFSGYRYVIRLGISRFEVHKSTHKTLIHASIFKNYNIRNPRL